MEMKNVRRRVVVIVFVAIAIAFLLFIIIFVTQKKGSPLVIQIGNKNEMMEIQKYAIHIETNADYVNVFINGKRVDKLFIHSEELSYSLTKLDKKGYFKEGWNDIRFEAKRFFVNQKVESSGMINCIKGKPDVFIPEEVLLDARTKNQNLHKEDSFYDEFFKNCSYQWNGSTLDGVLYNATEFVVFDAMGIPMVKYGDDYYYNPVTMAQHALGCYNEYVDKNDVVCLDTFINIADWFVENNNNGAFPYQIEFALKTNFVLYEGFISGMAQGQVLSALSRAYYLTNDEKYLSAGLKILEFTLNDADKDIYSGSRKSLEDFTKSFAELQEYSELLLPEEYVTNPSSYVLNGDLIALLGLYDWWQGVPEEYGSLLAKTAFFEAIDAIKVLLPYYDYYGWTSYDLLQYTFGESSPHFGSTYAHYVHVQHLHILYLLTGDMELAHWRDVFLSYETDSFYRQTEVICKSK